MHRTHRQDKWKLDMKLITYYLQPAVHEKVN